MPAWETKPQSLHSSNSPSSTRKAFSSERGSAKALLKASAAACVLCEFDCSEYVLGVCDVVFENDWCLELMSLVAVSIFARIMININQSCTCRSTFKHWFLCKPVLQDSRRLCVLYHTVASGQSMPACGTQSSMSTSRLATELPLLWVYDRPGVMKAERLTRHISKFYNRTNTGGSPVSGPTIEHFQEIHPKSDRLKTNYPYFVSFTSNQEKIGLHWVTQICHFHRYHPWSFWLISTGFPTLMQSSQKDATLSQSLQGI